MKGIIKIAKRLMLVFLALIVSSTMFLSSPAVAATSSLVLLTQANFETEILEADKPVVVILVSERFPGYTPSLLEELKAKAEEFYGDKYKVVAGKIEENQYAYRTVRAPAVYPPFPGVVGFKNGEPTQGIYLNPNDPTQGFEFVKGQLG